MSIYQLRFPMGSSLWTLEERLISEIWHVLSLHTEWKDASDDHFLLLANLVHQFLNRHVKSFTVCGGWGLCHANLVSTSWSIASAVIDDRTSKDHQILLLEVERDLDSFLIALEEIIFDDFCGHIATAQWVTAKAQFDLAIRKAFGPYILLNTSCEQCPRCTPRERLNPWIGQGSGYPDLSRPKIEVR